MSIKFYDKSGESPQEKLLAGVPVTDQILNATSKNPIANKAVYNALRDKIDKTVNDLLYYYSKTDVYNKSEVRELIGAIDTLTMEVVSTLPVSDISTTTIYLLKQSGSNVYDEYVYISDAWVKIGTTEMDLSGYLTVANFNIAIADYYTKSEIDVFIDNFYTKSEIDTDFYDKVDMDELLDGKQDELTFDSAPTKESVNPVTSGGIYDSEQDIYNVMGQNGAKNLYNNTMVSNTVSGVTFTKNSDGSVTVNGTATETIDFQMNLNVALRKGEYILSGSPSGGGYATNYCLWLHNANHDVVEGGEGQSFSVASDESGIVMSIVVYQGTTVNSLVFKPMIRLASDTDDTYVPHAMSNREITDRLNAVNPDASLSHTFTTQGETWTAPCDGYIIGSVDYRDTSGDMKLTVYGSDFSKGFLTFIRVVHVADINASAALFVKKGMKLNLEIYRNLSNDGSWCRFRAIG